MKICPFCECETVVNEATWECLVCYEWNYLKNECGDMQRLEDHYFSVFAWWVIILSSITLWVLAIKFVILIMEKF